MSVLENACMASTASAAGYSTGSTIATMFGAMVLLHEIPPGQTAANVKTWDVTAPWIVTLFTFLTALMGVFLAIPMKRQMINHEQLPFPSGIAAAETLRSLYSQSREAITKAYVLLTGLSFGALVALLRAGDDLVNGIPFLKKAFEWIQSALFRIRIPENLNLPLPSALYPTGVRPNGFTYDTSALLIAAGMIVGLRVSFSMLASSLLLYFVIGPWLSGLDQAKAGVSGYVPNMGLAGGVLAIQRWALWGGTAVMVFASLTSVALQWKTLFRAFSGISAEAEVERAEEGNDLGRRMAAIEVPNKWMIAGMLPIGIAMIWLQYVAFGVAWWVGLIAVAMAFVLSMVGSRATGETDTTPIGAMGKVMQLLFAIIPATSGKIDANLASAGIAANSASSSADLLTDLKTGYILGANPRKQFLAQFIGVFFGTVAIIPIWYLMVPTRAKLETFQLPSTQIWVAVAQALTKGIDYLPVSARWAIVIGAIVGIALPVIERLLPPHLRKYMPSATGIGLAWVVSFANSFSFAIGSVIAALWLRLHRRSAESFNVPLASGLIAGESLVAAGLAIIATVIGLMIQAGWLSP
jgi:OPT family oligopeptide transporter